MIVYALILIFVPIFIVNFSSVIHCDTTDKDNNNNNNDNINDNNKGNKKDNEQIICSSSTAKFFSITDSKSILNNVFNNLNLSEEQKSSVVEYVAQKIIKKLKR